MGLLLLLKTFQRLGYFVRYAEIPTAIISHIARCADYPDVPTGLDTYDESAARARHMALVRNFVGVTAYGYSARKIVVDASLQAARTRDDLPDIINVALEELARQRYELPGFSTLLKIARAAKTLPRRASIRALAQHKTHRTLSLPNRACSTMGAVGGLVPRLRYTL